MKSFFYNPNARWPESDDRPCAACNRPEEGPHCYPCVDDHDLELLAAEMAERECLDGYDVADAMTTSERWVSGL